MGSITQEDIDFLRASALDASGGVARLCLHSDPSALQHDMVVALTTGCQQRIHRHPEKPETLHVIEGTLTVSLFNDDGVLLRREFLSRDQQLLTRIPSGVWHLVQPDTEVSIFHESRPGPFDRLADAEFALWTVGETDKV